MRSTNGTLTTICPKANVVIDGRKPSIENIISEAKPNASAGSIRGDMKIISSTRAHAARLRAMARAAATPITLAGRDRDDRHLEADQRGILDLIGVEERPIPSERIARRRKSQGLVGGE